MTPLLHRTRPDARTVPWPDQWLADAAAAAGLGVALHLIGFLDLPTAWEALICAGMSEESVLELACRASDTPPADLSRAGPADALLLPEQLARALDVAPIGTDGVTLAIATANAFNPSLVIELERETQHRVVLRTASPVAVRIARRRIYVSRSTQARARTMQRITHERLRDVLIAHERDTPPDGLEWLPDVKAAG